MKKVLYVTSRLPALTVTFIYKEIHRLQSMGREVSFVSMNTPSDGEISADARAFVKDTDYLDSVGLGAKFAAFVGQCARHPLRMLTAFGIVISARPMQGPRDYARLGYHLVEAAYLARKYKDRGFEHIHCHFINGPSSIGMFLGLLLDVPFSFTMHASMIWLDPIAFSNKLKRCKFCASISEYNKRYVVTTYGESLKEKIHIVHCGIDPELPALPAAERKPGGLAAVGPRAAKPAKGVSRLG